MADMPTARHRRGRGEVGEVEAVDGRLGEHRAGHQRQPLARVTIRNDSRSRMLAFNVFPHVFPALTGIDRGTNLQYTGAPTPKNLRTCTKRASQGLAGWCLDRC